MRSAVAFCLLAAHAGRVASAPAAWPQRGFDAQHTGRSHLTTGPLTAPTVAWSVTTGDSVYSSCAIDDRGVVYFGDWDNELRAVNGSTGAVLWSVSDASGDSSPALSPDGARLYVGSIDNALVAFNTSTGARLWARPAGGEIYASPTVAADGTVYFGSWDKSVYAVDGATGAVRWSFALGGAIYSSVAVSADGALAFVASYDERVYALNATAGGSVVWSYSTLSWFEASPAVDDRAGAVYIGGFDGLLYAFDAATGALRWKFATGGAIWASAVIAADGSLVMVRARRLRGRGALCSRGRVGSVRYRACRRGPSAPLRRACGRPYERRLGEAEPVDARFHACSQPPASVTPAPILSGAGWLDGPHILRRERVDRRPRVERGHRRRRLQLRRHRVERRSLFCIGRHVRVRRRRQERRGAVERVDGDRGALCAARARGGRRAHHRR